MKLMTLALTLACATAGWSASATATEYAYPERTDITLTLGSLGYTESGDSESGMVIGIEARTPLARHWSIGAALAGGSDFALFSDELSIDSAELNVARLLPLSDRAAVNLGGGLAAVRGDYHDFVLFGDDVDIEAWVLGGQIFGGLDFAPGRFVVGVKALYQFTQEFEDMGWGLDNYRLAMRAGIGF
jgi:opacity protein-like surface antigen